MQTEKYNSPEDCHILRFPCGRFLDGCLPVFRLASNPEVSSSECQQALSAWAPDKCSGGWLRVTPAVPVMVPTGARCAQSTGASLVHADVLLNIAQQGSW